MKCDMVTTTNWTLVHFYQKDALKIISRAMRSGFWIVMHTKCPTIVQSKYLEDYTDSIWLSKDGDIELAYLYLEFYQSCMLTDKDIEHQIEIEKSLETYFKIWNTK